MLEELKDKDAKADKNLHTKEASSTDCLTEEQMKMRDQANADDQEVEADKLRTSGNTNALIIKARKNAIKSGFTDAEYNLLRKADEGRPDGGKSDPDVDN
jgi:hypothetical protein